MTISLTPLQPNLDFRVGTILRESWRLFRAHPITYLIVVAVFVAATGYLLDRVPSLAAGASVSRALLGMAATGMLVSATIAAISIGVAAMVAQDKPSPYAMIIGVRLIRTSFLVVGVVASLPFMSLIALGNGPGPVLSLAALIIFVTATAFFWPLIPVLAAEEPAIWRGFHRALRLSQGYRLHILILEIVLMVPGLGVATAVRFMIEQRSDPTIVFIVGWGLLALWLLAVSLAMVVSFFILRDATNERDPEPIAKVFD